MEITESNCYNIVADCIYMDIRIVKYRQQTIKINN